MEPEIKLIPAFLWFYEQPKRFKFSYGGRGGGKSIAYADLLLMIGRERRIRILCTREVQKSIKDSVHTLLKDRIEFYGLMKEFTVTANEISHINGTSFIFTGLREHNVDSIKSYQGIDYCWVEEAQTVTKRSLDILTPTIREDNSEIWFSYNRFFEGDPVHALFNSECHDSTVKTWDIDGKTYRWVEWRGDNAIGIFINYDGNPYFPEVLRLEMEKDKKNDFDLYLHKWQGEPLQQSDDSFISRALVMSAVSRSGAVWDNPHIGIDPARFGDDESVIYWRTGDHVHPCETFRGIDTVKLAGKVIEIVHKIRAIHTLNPRQPIKVKVDDTGVGGGVTDQLRIHADSLNLQVMGMVNNGEASDRKYKDLGTEMWGRTKDLLAQTDLPNDSETISQLTTRKYRIEPDGRIKLERKADMKKRGLHSPDRADALALCMYEPPVVARAWDDVDDRYKSPVHGIMDKQF